MHYNITILHIRAGQPHPMLKGIEGWLGQHPSKGQFLACWYADIGNINQLLLMHAYQDIETLHAERTAWIASGACFGIPKDLTGVTMRAGKQMAGLPELQPGKLGPIYEVRTYVMMPHDHATGMQAWADAVPGRAKVTKPLIIMQTTDGPATGLIHIWPYPTVDERMRVRREVIEKGIWPPKNGARYIDRQQSDIFLPAPFSPLA